jgi:hypothetical protein
MKIFLTQSRQGAKREKASHCVRLPVESHVGAAAAIQVLCANELELRAPILEVMNS